MIHYTKIAETGLNLAEVAGHIIVTTPFLFSLKYILQQVVKEECCGRTIICSLAERV